MREVMNACVIMHNMTIESECDAYVDDDQPFDYQVPLAEVEHVHPKSSRLSFTCMKKYKMQMLMPTSGESDCAFVGDERNRQCMI
jgi:hypothetical protein